MKGWRAEERAEILKFVSDPFGCCPNSFRSLQDPYECNPDLIGSVPDLLKCNNQAVRNAVSSSWEHFELPRFSSKNFRLRFQS